jgi:hypothetical protein
MTLAKALPQEKLVSYDEDILLWSQQQARLLRERRFAELDLEHLADEIEDVGKSEKRELASRVAVLLAQLIKWKVQRQRRSSSWEATIRDQRRRIVMLLDETPSLNALCINNPQWIAGVWLDARVLARKEMRIKGDAMAMLEDSLWRDAVWPMGTILDPVFWPD